MNWEPPKDSCLHDNTCWRDSPFLIQQVNFSTTKRFIISNYAFSDIEAMRPDDHNTVAIFHVKPKS